jgi:hypothetical protein
MGVYFYVNLIKSWVLGDTTVDKKMLMQKHQSASK